MSSVMHGVLPLMVALAYTLLFRSHVREALEDLHNLIAHLFKRRVEDTWFDRFIVWSVCLVFACPVIEALNVLLSADA